MNYFILISLAFILIASLLSVMIWFIFKIKKPKKIFKQITKHYYFDNNEPENKKWWVSKDGKFEKKWLEVQNKKYVVKYFGYIEQFNIGFSSSSYNRTKFILSDLVDLKSSQKTIVRIKQYNICIENIWWKKYKPIFEGLFNDLPNITAAPEYFFFKYYFKFLSEIKKIILNSFCDTIIPNIIIQELKQNDYRKLRKYIDGDHWQNVVNAFEKVAYESQEFFDLIFNELKNELKEKGSKWKINYLLEDPLISSFLPEEIVHKNELRQKILELTKKYRLPVFKEIEEGLHNLEIYLKNIEIEKMTSIRYLYNLYYDEVKTKKI